MLTALDVEIMTIQKVIFQCIDTIVLYSIENPVQERHKIKFSMRFRGLEIHFLWSQISEISTSRSTDITKVKVNGSFLNNLGIT